MSSGEENKRSAISDTTGDSSRSVKANLQDKASNESRKQETRSAELQRAMARDFQRHGRRQDNHLSYWRWLGLLGMVGWPIAIMTVGGALLGHYIDERFHTGIQFTLLLLTIGAVVSSLVAWRALGANR